MTRQKNKKITLKGMLQLTDWIERHREEFEHSGKSIAEVTREAATRTGLAVSWDNAKLALEHCGVQLAEQKPLDSEDVAEAALAKVNAIVETVEVMADTLDQINGRVEQLHNRIEGQGKAIKRLHQRIDELRTGEPQRNGQPADLFAEKN